MIRAVLAGESASDSIGLGNVDARLRQVYGDAYGLVVETQVDAGTKVTLPDSQILLRSACVTLR